MFGSDFHIGNSKIPAELTHLNLKDYFYPTLKDAQLLLLGGDFFHRLLKLDEPSSLEAISIVQELIDIARKHDIIIRVLRGTYTHDRLQNAIFTSVLSQNSFNVNLVCIDTISVEYIEECDIRILYIPDNLPYKSKDECLQHIHELLETYDWDTVDLVVGHGYFEHVLPPRMDHLPPILFEYDDFKSIVTGYVLMGHVHTSSVYKNIIYNGSFERFAHGEEEDKGFYTINYDGKWHHNFVKNKDATLFYTIEPSGNTIEELQSSLEKFINKKFNVSVPGFLRIIYSNPDIRQILVQTVTDAYPTLCVSSKATKELKEQKQFIHQFQKTEQVAPNKENIPELILNFIIDTKGSSTLTRSIIVDKLQLNE